MFQGEYRDGNKFKSHDMKYSIYKARQTLSNFEAAEKKYIVLRDAQNRIVQYTGLEMLCTKYTGNPIDVRYSSTLDPQYICKALNWMRSHCGSKRIIDINVDQIFTFFEAYRNSPKTCGGEDYRGQQALDKCVKSVSYFFANLALIDSRSNVETERLVAETWITEPDKDRPSAQASKIYLPCYQNKAKTAPKRILIRDIPPEAMEILLRKAAVYDPLLYYGIQYQLLTGMRPGELMNLRQPTSPLSVTPGISFSYQGEQIKGGTIDLTREFVLRSDGVSVGKIKRERTLHIYPGCLQAFYYIYQQHMALIKRSPTIEDGFQPMFFNQQGKAMTYATYCNRFRTLVTKHVVPELIQSGNAGLQAAGLAFMANPPAPHALRHYFTCMLVLDGLNAAQIQFYRGDNDPQSAIRYLQNKGIITQEMKRIYEIVLTALRS